MNDAPALPSALSGALSREWRVKTHHSTDNAPLNRKNVRAIAAVQAVGGAVLALRPDAAHRLAGEPRHSGPPAWLVRVLGLRMLAQAGLEAVRPQPRVVLAAAAVDTAHALSMAGYAAVTARYRRPALISGAFAAASAATLYAGYRHTRSA